MDEVGAYVRLAGVYDTIVVDPCYSAWASFLDDLWRRDPAGVSAVLDVCCGTGLMAAELFARGYRVVGTDASTAMLAAASDRLGPDVELVEAALPRVGTDQTFDAAISTFDGLNYLTADDFRRSVAAVGARLRPKGWLVFDVHTDAMMDFTAANPVVSGESHGSRFVITSTVDRGARTCVTRIEVPETSNGRPFAEVHRQFFHAADRIAGDLRAAGFAQIEVTDEYTSQPVGPETLRATWVARLGPGLQPGG